MKNQELESLAAKIEAIPDTMSACSTDFRLGVQAAARVARGQKISGAIPPGKEQVTVSESAPVVRAPAG